MDEPKKYTLPEEEHMMVSEPAVAYNETSQQIVLNIPRGTDANKVRSRVNLFYTHLINELAEEQEFLYYRDNWEKETCFSSSISTIISNKNFVSIVNMGERVIPYILRDIQRQPSFLFIALEQICRENLIKPERQGCWNHINVTESCKKWAERLTQ